MSGPLTGIRVLDLGAMLSGPWAADILGDQGADVIKVEPIRGGDHVRRVSPGSGGLPPLFLNINRSKRSIAVDLKAPAGREALLGLVLKADVLIHNFRPGVVERLAIGYDELSAINPRLVFVAISGFGEIGPYRDKRVYDPIVQAVSGLASIQAGSDEGRPRMVRTVLPDKITAVTASQAVAVALVARARTGRGDHIRLSMLDTMMSFLWATDMDAYTYVEDGLAPMPPASATDLMYETRDGYLTLSTMTDAEWLAFCTAVERADLLVDPRFASAPERSRNDDEKRRIVQDVLRERSAEEWIPVLEEHDVPCAPALRRFEVIQHPQLAASGTLIETDHPVGGRLRQARPAAQFASSPPSPPRGAPALGEHTVEILESLGYSRARIDALVADGVVTDGARRDSNLTTTGTQRQEM